MTREPFAKVVDNMDMREWMICSGEFILGSAEHESKADHFCEQANLAHEAAVLRAVEEFRERAAKIPDLWVNSITCNDDGTACKCKRVSFTIAEAIRKLEAKA